MRDIAKIVIKGASGYGPSNEAYEDKIVIKPGMISYLYKPFSSDCGQTVIKWKYCSESKSFKDWYQMVCHETEEQLNNENGEFYTDVGGVDITVIYSDRTKRSRYFCVATNYFSDYFRLIKEMVPSGEKVPCVLMTNEDYSNSHWVDVGKYRHFKGNEYEVMGMAKNSETEQDMVIYKALYGEGDIWVRPAAMWDETIYRNGKMYKRFTSIDGE